MEQLKILEIINRWWYLTGYQISDLLHKKQKTTERRLFAILVSKKLLRMTNWQIKISTCFQVFEIENLVRKAKI